MPPVNGSNVVIGKSSWAPGAFHASGGRASVVNVALSPPATDGVTPPCSAGNWFAPHVLAWAGKPSANHSRR